MVLLVRRVAISAVLRGVTDKSLLEGRDAPWSPRAWRSFKMSRTVPSSLGAEALAMSVALDLSSAANIVSARDLQEASRMCHRLLRACTIICPPWDCKTSAPSSACQSPWRRQVV